MHRRFPLIHGGKLGRGGRLARSHTTTLSNVKDLGVMLQPVEVSRQFLSHITLSSGRKADHDDDEFGSEIPLRDASIGGDLGLGQTRNIERCRTDTAGGWGLGS